MAGRPKFTRIPKVTTLIQSGVPAEAIPTYCALADHANNKTGLCWPKMETLAKMLNRSVRTIQRHLHILREIGLIEFVERRRYKGRFSSYLYKVCLQATTGHGRRMDSRRSNKRRTKPSKNTPHSPPKEGYEWLFDQPQTSKGASDYEKQRAEDREKASRKRQEGYEWLFS